MINLCRTSFSFSTVAGEDGGSCIGCKNGAEASTEGRDFVRGPEPWQEQAKGGMRRDPCALIQDTLCCRTACVKCAHGYSLLLENCSFLYDSHHLPGCHWLFRARLGGLVWRWSALKSPAELDKEGSQVCRVQEEGWGDGKWEGSTGNKAAGAV